jgi:hypothetical protein
MQIKFLVIAIVGAVLLSGCTANHNTAFRMRNLEGTDPVLFSMDAKQRAIIVSNYQTFVGKNANGVETTELTRRFCSEPSPDVFSIMAQSLGAGGSFGKSGDPASIEAAFNLAFSSAEQGSTIPRTQTVNLLRELMFRTCERYVSGGYDETELSIQAVRDQRLMVSILAIESLTGAVAPKPVVIGLAGSAAAGLETAEQSAAEAAAAYSEENGDDTVCDAIDGKEEDELTDAQREKIEPCRKVREQRSAAQEELGKARASHSELATLLRSGGVMAQTVATQGATSGGFDQSARAGEITQIAGAVKAIVDRNFSDDTEVMLFCLKALGSGADAEKLQNMIPICIEYFKNRVGAASAVAQAETAVQIYRATVEFEAGTAARFDQFWTKSGAGLSTPEGRKTLADRLAATMIAPEKSQADCFRTSGARDVVRACFERLTIPQQDRLLQF